MSCADCHVFAGYDDPAHIDGDGRAEVIFGARASAADATPEYDADTGSCADTYCHGGGRFGSGAAVVWSGGSGDQAACGTCHANPPSAETGHPNVPASLACSACHSDVVEVDEDDPTLIRIIDSSLHMNGETDL
jgi:predicted CxxxxCH...CXXCH cytochrome family protein